MTYTINLTKDELDMLQFVYNEYINRDDLFQMDLEPNKEQIFHDVSNKIAKEYRHMREIESSTRRIAFDEPLQQLTETKLN